MQFSSLTDGELIRKLENLTSFERTSLVAVLHCLTEMRQRRLYSDMGFRSLFHYCVEKLRYPEDQAQRRIVAARMLRELPEIEREIERGALNLTVMGMLDGHFKRERIENRRKKLELIRSVLGKNTREIERILATTARRGGKARPDRIRAISETQIELRFVANNALEEKIEKTRGALAHKHPDLGFGALFELLCDNSAEKPNDSPPAAPRVTARQRKPSRWKQVFTRDGGKCTLCGSTHALEVDHIIPKAKGGPDTLENLRLLCRSCNQRAAVKEYGQEKMNQYM